MSSPFLVAFKPFVVREKKKPINYRLILSWLASAYRRKTTNVLGLKRKKYMQKICIHVYATFSHTHKGQRAHIPKDLPARESQTKAG